jgi:hypothetical protein
MLSVGPFSLVEPVIKVRATDRQTLLTWVL